MLNKLLLRQIQKHLGTDTIHTDYLYLFQAISESYDHYEREHKLLERAIDLSSSEMIVLNKELSEETRKLKGAHREMETLFENIEEVFFSIDVKSEVLIQMSQACRKIYGYPASDFFLKPDLWREVIHPGDREVTDRHFVDLHKGKNIICEYRIFRSDGAERWVETKIIPTMDGNGKLVRIDGITNDITTKKQAEIMLVESEKKYRHVFDNPFLGVAIGTLDGFVTNANEKFCSILGYSKDEILNMHFSRFTCSLDVQAENLLIEKMARGEIDGYNLEKRYVTKSGLIIWVELSITCVRNENKQRQFVLASVQDITIRKRTEKSLLESQANLRNILENTETAYVLLDNLANILTFNKVAQRMAMSQGGGMLVEGRNYIDISYEKSSLKSTIEELLRTGNEVKYETAYIQTDMSVKWYYISMHPIFDANNAILGLSIAATDITDRKKKEIQIKQHNERYKLVTKATKDVIWDWNILGRKFYRSANFKRRYGYSYSNENTPNNSWMFNIHEDDKERVSISIEQTLKEPSTTLWENQYRYYRANGEIAHIEDRAYIVRDRNKKPIRMVGAMRDITDEKKLSIERDKITADLLQRNRDLEQFAYIISHNLRLPVSNIIGLVNLIHSSTTTLSKKDYEHCLAGLLTSTNKLDDVIKDLNNILQLRQRIDKERKINICFSELIQDIQIGIADLIRKENVKIVTNFQVDHIVTLKSYIYSIFFNLISNSVKYRNGKDPLIEIASERKKNKIVLTFKDNGMGIDLEAQSSKIFGLYNKFHTETEGKGVGLYMTKTQVELLGGQISVKSAINKGTEFRIELNS
jgi:PAS domain S-box-containing protein